VKPSVGRICHYVSRGSADGAFPSVCRAAVIAEVVDTSHLPANPLPEHRESYPMEPVRLCVLNPSGIFFDECDRCDAGDIPGTWHWPEWVE
jgi:hypothetical protein